MLLSLCCLFTACPSDDPKEKQDTTEFNASFSISDLINYKWKSTDVSSGQAKNNDNHIWVDVDSYYLYFKSDKTGVLSMILKDYDTVLGNTTQREYILFNYTVSGNIITVTTENGQIWKLTYSNECLIEGTSTLYFPTAMSSGDYEYLNSIGPKTGNSGSGITYSYDERTKELIISGSGRMNDYTTSSQPWHDYVIEKVTIKDGCTYIGAHAFHGLKYNLNVREVSLPNSVKEIGNQSFSGISISELSLPTSIEKIGNGAFSGCEELKSVSFFGCNNLEEIDDYAFQSCPITLDYFTLPNNVRKVGDWAFSSSIITKLTLNDSLETVGLNAFSELKQSQLVIPNSVKSIGHLAFQGSFTEIRIGSGLSILGGVPFLGAYKGSLYMNQSKPLSLSKDFIMNKDGNNVAALWTLYVPKGSKTAYQKASGWDIFKSIVEDSSLEGSTSGNEGNDDQNSNNNNNENNGNNNSQPDLSQNHEYVNLGLPSGTLWAICNIGASKPEEYGNYYAWGETKTKSVYNWDTYQYYNHNLIFPDCYIDIGSDIAGTQYDAATANWGGPWRMPTKMQCVELINNTTSVWTTQNGVYGRKFTGSNGGTIFLPAAGCRLGGELHYAGDRGYYWSSTLSWRYPYFACSLYFGSGSADWAHYYYRSYGFPVRPVRRN